MFADGKTEKCVDKYTNRLLVVMNELSVCANGWCRWVLLLYIKSDFCTWAQFFALSLLMNLQGIGQMILLSRLRQIWDFHSRTVYCTIHPVGRNQFSVNCASHFKSLLFREIYAFVRKVVFRHADNLMWIWNWGFGRI